MPAETLSEDVLNIVARSLVVRQKCATRDEALRQLAVAAVRDKMAHYRRRLRKLERKHAIDFAGFTSRLQGRATPTEEDDWLAWKAAERMLADWQRAYRELLNIGTC